MEDTTIAVDFARSVFQVAVSHRPGRIDEERRLVRDRFLAFFDDEPCRLEPIDNPLTRPLSWNELMS